MRTLMVGSTRLITLLAGLSLFSTNALAKPPVDTAVLRGPVVSASPTNAAAPSRACVGTPAPRGTCQIYGQTPKWIEKMLGDAKMECSWASVEDQNKYASLVSVCGWGPGDCLYEQQACKDARKAVGIGPCEATYTEAMNSFNAFKTSCAETKIGSALQCLEEARQCSLSRQSESEAEESEEDQDEVSTNALWKMLGLDDTKVKPANDKPLQCSNLGLKDYNTERREMTRSLRDAEKEMAELKKDSAKDAEEFSTKKKDLSEAFTKAQTDTREKMTEAQEKSSDAGMQAQQQIMDIEDQKASLRSEIIKIYGEKANIIGARAASLADLSDAMIQKNCLTAVEEEEKKMRKGLVSGFSNYLVSRKIRTGRLEATRDACIVKSEAIRAATYRSYSEQLKGLDEAIANANRRIEALGSQSSGVATSNQKAIQRAEETQKALTTEQSTAQQTIYQQMQELQQTQTQRQIAASESMKQAQDRMSDATADIRNLGKKPKGDKAPIEAASKFDEFASKVKAMNESTCKDRVTDLLKVTVQDNKLTTYYEKGANFSDQDETAEASPTPGQR